IIEPGVVLTPIWNKAEALMPDGHPYQQAMGRLARLFGAPRDGGVKPDAEVVAAARDRMTAGEWAALLTEEDEERFVSRAEESFGVDLYNPPSLNARK